MKELEERILKDGIILPGEVLMVGGFLNQQIDTTLLKHMAEEVKRLFDGYEITKVLTIEASGIAFAAAVAMELGVPMVFAKKHASRNMIGNIVSAEVKSYTHGDVSHIQVNKDYIKESDKVLVCDDFLATGNALEGLIGLVKACGASLAGCAIEIEKEFQGGGNQLREKGIKVESLAKITEFKNNIIKF